jgi:hypothetical protein
MNYTPAQVRALLKQGTQIDRAHSGHETITNDRAQAIGSEYALQAAVIAECKRLALTIPEYDWVYAIPNGQYRKGQRLEPGVKAGYPDLGWDLARGGFHGWRCELKYKDNKPGPEQVAWARWLESQGLYVVTIWDSVSEVLSNLEQYRIGAQKRRKRA